MKVLIIYDSFYGNTFQVAQAIARGLDPMLPHVLNVKDVDNICLKNIDLLIIGSPTHAGNASKPIKDFLASLNPDILAGIRTAVFDTSIPQKGQRFLLRMFLRILGSASERMAKILKIKGAVVVAHESFFVQGKTGPLKEGEQNRAQTWAATLLKP